MRNLMKTGLFRLKRQKAFWISLLLMMIFGLVRTLSLNGDPDSTLASGFFTSSKYLTEKIMFVLPVC